MKSPESSIFWRNLAAGVAWLKGVVGLGMIKERRERREGRKAGRKVTSDANTPSMPDSCNGTWASSRRQRRSKPKVSLTL